MYRAAALSVLRTRIPVQDTPALERHLSGIDVTLSDNRVYLDGEDVTTLIRTQEIGQATSSLSALAPVREKLTPLQRKAAASGGVVLEGRDTGTVVCPDADVKFYLTASLEERARRRHAELEARGVPSTLAAVDAEIRARDAQDQSRALAPLRKPADAVEIDSTNLTLNEVVDRMLAVVEGRRCSTRS
jgi:cytidylate kinase